MVAGVQKVCIWKAEISWISQKGEFSRGAMEKALGLNTGQAEWYIKELIKKGIIERTNKFVHKIGKGQRQVIYSFLK